MKEKSKRRKQSDSQQKVVQHFCDPQNIPTRHQISFAHFYLFDAQFHPSHFHVQDKNEKMVTHATRAKNLWKIRKMHLWQRRHQLMNDILFACGFILSHLIVAYARIRLYVRTFTFGLFDAVADIVHIWRLFFTRFFGFLSFALFIILSWYRSF